METIKKMFEGFGKYIKGVQSEFKRISWPSKQELHSSTIIVLITLFTVTVYLYVWDFVFLRLFSYFTGVKN